MSGILLDGIDVVIVIIFGVGFNIKIEFIVVEIFFYFKDILEKVKLVIDNELRVRDVLSFNFEFGRFYVDCVIKLCKDNKLSFLSLSFIVLYG